MKKHMLLALAALAALAFNAAAATLSIGDAAPELKVSKWVKGGAVAKLDADKTYVVEFWATWCGPCRASIPHLTEMAHTYTNIIFIGTDVWERGDKDATVTKFVEKMGDKMDYHVAMDTDDTFMANNWMKAADQNGIPTAFLVQKGKIIWIGHPMGLEPVLKEVAAGKFNIEKAKQRAAAEKKVEAFYEKAMTGGDVAALQKEGKELEALDKEIGGISPDGEKFDAQQIIKQAKFSGAMRAWQKAVMSGADTNETAKLEASAKALAPEEMNFDAIKKQLQQMAAGAKGGQQAGEIFEKYIAAVGENGDKEKAAALAKQLVELKIKDPHLLNEMAWTILTGEDIKQRDLPLATKLAKAAVDASDAKDAASLDTYARALFDSGKAADAVEFQKKAIAATEDADAKSELGDTLKKYQAAADKAK